MKGLILCLIVIVAVDAVRSQTIPKTRTKKGKRPARLNDNPDFGLPSGADYPDSQRLNPKRPAPAGRPVAARPVPPASAGRPVAARPAPPAPAGKPVAAQPAPPAPAGRPVAARPAPQAPAGRPVAVRPAPPARAGRPVAAQPVPPASAKRPAPVKAVAARANANNVPQTQVRSGPPPPNRRPAGRNDNPDRGMPSGQDVPDNRVTRTRSGPPPPSAGNRRFNDNPDFGLPTGRDFPDAWLYPMPMPTAPAPAPVDPIYDCDFFCRNEGYKPVCTTAGNTYDNDCLRQCRNEPRECENACPCNGGGPDIAPVVQAAAGPCDYCYNEDYSPVCSDEETIYNECFANCQGNTVTCTSTCPCV